MEISILKRLFSLIEESPGALSVRQLASELDITQERAESMMHYWVQKGRIRVSAGLTDCTSCSTVGDCPFVMEMPMTYELVKEGQGELIKVIQPACK